MRIDNSAFQAFWTCPTKYRYAYKDGLQKQVSYFEFGKRFHRLLERHYQPEVDAMDSFELTPDKPLLDTQMENEVQVLFEAYKAAYPTEDFEVVDCERSFELELPPTTVFMDGSRARPKIPHLYLGRIDMSVRKNGKLSVFESKTESRSSKRNSPRAWAARSQASLYTWAASQLYNEPIDSVILNICTKASPKGLIGPSFRRDILERTPQQVEQALRDLIYVADQLEEMQESGVYPRNTNSCVNEFGYDCDFYLPCHHGGMTPEILASYVQIEPFAHLEL